jgi:hypothetical protein
MVPTPAVATATVKDKDDEEDTEDILKSMEELELNEDGELVPKAKPLTLTSASTTVDEDGVSVFPTRAFAHCLRALASLERGDVAEAALVETVTVPLAKSLITQGKVDGTGTTIVIM